MWRVNRTRIGGLLLTIEMKLTQSEVLSQVALLMLASGDPPMGVILMG